VSFLEGISRVTTWLDHVLAMPTIGCDLKPTFQSAQDYISALRPMLKQWGTTTDIDVATDKPLSLTIRRKPGFAYSFEVNKFVVQFRYLYEVKQMPGQVAPELIDAPEVQKFTSLLESVASEFSEVFDHLAASESKGLTRIGVVASCRLDGESLPPGVTLFIRHLTRPWGGKALEKCQTHLLATISEDEKFRDRCHHQIDITVDRPNDVRLVLDWQRLFSSELQIGRGKLIREQVKKCSEQALQYFERFGKGDLGYGDLG
jgi:hypothetical protein